MRHLRERLEAMTVRSNRLFQSDDDFLEQTQLGGRDIDAIRNRFLNATSNAYQPLKYDNALDLSTQPNLPNRRHACREPS